MNVSPSSSFTIQHAPGAASPTPVKARTSTSSRRQVTCGKSSPRRAPAPTVAKDAIALSARSVRIAQTGGEPLVGKANLFINHARTLDAVGRTELLVELQQAAARNQVNPSPHFDRQLYTDAIDYIKQSMSGPHDEMQDLVKDLPATLAQEATRPGDTHALYRNLLSVAADAIPGDRHTDAHKDKQREFVANLLSAFTLAGDIKPEDLKALLGHLPQAERVAMARVDKYTMAPVGKQLRTHAQDAHLAFGPQADALLAQQGAQITTQSIIDAARNLDEYRSYVKSMPEASGKEFKDLDPAIAKKADALKNHLLALLNANRDFIHSAEPDQLRGLHDALKTLDIDRDKEIQDLLDQRIKVQRAACEKAVVDAVLQAGTQPLDTTLLLTALDGAGTAARNLDAAQRHRDGLPKDDGDGGAKLLDSLFRAAIARRPQDQATQLRKTLLSPALGELERKLESAADAGAASVDANHKASAARMGACASLLASMRKHACDRATAPQGPVPQAHVQSQLESIKNVFKVDLDVSKPLAACQESINMACKAIADDKPLEMLKAMDDLFTGKIQLRKAQQLAGDKTATGASEADLFRNLIQDVVGKLPPQQKQTLTYQLNGVHTQAIQNSLHAAGARLAGSSNERQRQQGQRMSASADLLALIRSSTRNPPARSAITHEKMSDQGKAALKDFFKINADGSDWSEAPEVGPISGTPPIVKAPKPSAGAASDADASASIAAKAAEAGIGPAPVNSTARQTKSDFAPLSLDMIQNEMLRVGAAEMSGEDLSPELTNSLRNATGDSGSVSYSFKNNEGVDILAGRSGPARRSAEDLDITPGGEATAAAALLQSEAAFREVAGGLASTVSKYAHPGILDALKRAMNSEDSPIRLPDNKPARLVGGKEHTQFEVSANKEGGVVVHCVYDITGATSLKAVDGTTEVTADARKPASAHIAFSMDINAAGGVQLRKPIEAYYTMDFDMRQFAPSAMQAQGA